MRRGNNYSGARWAHKYDRSWLTTQQIGLLNEMTHHDKVSVPFRGYSRRTFQALSNKGLIDYRIDWACLTKVGREIAEKLS